MGMFDSVVDLHGKKKDQVWIYWVLGSGAIAAMGVAIFFIYRKQKTSGESASFTTRGNSTHFETADTTLAINEWERKKIERMKYL